LFVGEEFETVSTLPRILSQRGFSVTQAKTVPEALEKMSQDKFDVLISDLNLQSPRDGYKLVRAIRDANPLCVTVILTGDPTLDAALEGIRHRVDDYFEKPTDIDALVKSLEEKLKARRPKARILSVSYDETLLRTRQFLLQREGYDVVSSCGFTESLKLCEQGGFDLFILGHSIPLSDKQALIDGFRRTCVGPIISLQRAIGERLEGADFHINPDPEELLSQLSEIVSTHIREHPSAKEVA